MSFETAKNYQDRIDNGDFSNYLHGAGIDIGGGPDCLKLPPDVNGYVDLWDIMDGDAQYMSGVEDEKYDFVYSSHCLEHMRNISIAFRNWLRICRVGGYVYVCIPHEHYYEHDQWPSVYNPDHKWSFTVDEETDLPRNVEIRRFLKRYEKYIEIIDIRENLKNYDFSITDLTDQTHHENVCAQIEFIVRKRRNIPLSGRRKNKDRRMMIRDYFRYILPLQIKLFVKGHLPEPLKKAIKSIIK